MPHGVTPPKKNTLGKCVLSVQENEAPKGTVGLDLNSGLYVSVEGTAGLQSGAGVTVTAGLTCTALTKPVGHAGVLPCSQAALAAQTLPCCCLSLSKERPKAAGGPQKLRDRGFHYFVFPVES